MSEIDNTPILAHTYFAHLKIQKWIASNLRNSMVQYTYVVPKYFMHSMHCVM